LSVTSTLIGLKSDTGRTTTAGDAAVS